MSPALDPSIRSYSHPATSDVVLHLAARAGGLSGRKILDVGAGEGYFAQLVGAAAEKEGAVPSEIITACDLVPENFRYRGCECLRIDALGRLPFVDQSFDAACAIEVIEHLENPAHLARELYRVLRPGGRAIVTTPNVLNLNSRVRTLLCGFPVLFDPLPIPAGTKDEAVHGDTGHIMPLPAFHLAHHFLRAGFVEPRLHFDRYKASAMGWYALLAIPIALASGYWRWRLARRKPRAVAGNESIIGAINGRRLLTARTIVLEVRRPATAAP